MPRHAAHMPYVIAMHEPSAERPKTPGSGPAPEPPDFVAMSTTTFHAPSSHSHTSPSRMRTRVTAVPRPADGIRVSALTRRSNASRIRSTTCMVQSPPDASDPAARPAVQVATRHFGAGRFDGRALADVIPKAAKLV